MEVDSSRVIQSPPRMVADLIPNSKVTKALYPPGLPRGFGSRSTIGRLHRHFLIADQAAAQ